MNMKKQTLVFILSILFSWTTYATFTAETEEFIDIKIVDLNSIGGVVTYLEKGKNQYNFAYGELSKDEGHSTTNLTIFKIASLTKLFTTIAIAQLQEQGKVSFDDTVCQYLSYPSNHPLCKVDIKSLLSHTSGLPVDTGSLNDQTLESSKEELETWLKNLKPPLKPSYTYSNLGFFILGRIIEVISKENYEAYITNKILVPLKMYETFFDESKIKKKQFAQGYAYQNMLLKNPKITGYRPAAGLYSNAKDLEAFINFLTLQNNDQILKKRSLENLFKNELGFKTYSGGRIGHGGRIQGYRSLIQFDIKKQSALLILTNDFYSDVESLGDMIFWEIN